MSLDVIINVIKYWSKISIPNILIEIKKDVDNEIKKISKKVILVFFKILKNILIPKYVEITHAHKNGISWLLKNPCPIK